MKQGADIAGGSSACAHALAACVWRISATTAKELVTPCRPLLSRTVQPDFGLWRKFGGGNCDKMIRVNPNDLDQLAACRSADYRLPIPMPARWEIAGSGSRHYRMSLGAVLASTVDKRTCKESPK